MNDINEFIIDTTTTTLDYILNDTFYTTSSLNDYNNDYYDNINNITIFNNDNNNNGTTIINDNNQNSSSIITKKILCKFVMPNNVTYEDKYEFYMYGIILNLIGIIGIFGNILSMVILSRPQMRSSINYLLIGLARCDTILIITSMLLFGFRSIYPYSGYLFYYYYYISPQTLQYIYPLATAAQTASIYLTLTVSLERYVAVCHPLRARALCTYGRAKLYVIVCCIFAILFNFIKLWESKLLMDDTIEYGIIYCITSTQLRNNPMYITIYIHWCYLIVNYFIPFIGLSVFNLLIYNQVRKANRERQRLSRSEKREIGLATMLLCVVIAFFLFNLLALYINIREAFFNIIDDYAIVISNLLVTLNSSVNFIIYVIFGEKFQRIFLLLFCKNRIGRDSPDGLMHDDSSYSNGDGLGGGGGGGGGSGGMNRGTSGRFSRHGTLRTQSSTINGNSIKVHQRSIRLTRAPSPGPIVYYPARTTSLKYNNMNINNNVNNNNIVNNNNNNNNNNNIKNKNNYDRESTKSTTGF